MNEQTPEASMGGYLGEVQGDVESGQGEALDGVREAVALIHRHAVAGAVPRVQHHAWGTTGRVTGAPDAEVPRSTTI